MNWDAEVFFFIAVAFAVYVFARGDMQAWKAVLGGKVS